MANRKSVLSFLSAAVAALALAWNSHESEADRDERDIRQRIDEMAAAIGSMDLEQLMPIYAPDIVSFDIEPPLQHVGAEAKRRNWTRAFAAYERPLAYDVRELTITVSGDLAVARGLNRISGTLKRGKRNAYWVRWTACLRKVRGAWLITHDQISVPVDFESGKALLHLEPS